jgi:hypothetical protein
MTYRYRVWFFLFAPGERECITGYSDPIIRKTLLDDDDREYNDTEEMEALKTEAAKAFDVKLEHEIS